MAYDSRLRGHPIFHSKSQNPVQFCSMKNLMKNVLILQQYAIQCIEFTSRFKPLFEELLVCDFPLIGLYIYHTFLSSLLNPEAVSNRLRYEHCHYVELAEIRLVS